VLENLRPGSKADYQEIVDHVEARNLQGELAALLGAGRDQWKKALS
jgi:hypothetical protein